MSYKSSEEAKRDYFLTPDDLAEIYSFKEGGWGNNTRLFRPADLQRFALLKHGAEGLRKKQDARAKREATKRARELEAVAAEQLLFGAPPSPLGSVVELDDDGAPVVTGAKKARVAAGGGGASSAAAAASGFGGGGASSAAAAAIAAAAAPPPRAAPPPPPPPPPAAITAEDRAAAARLVAEAKRGFKEKLTWDFLRAKNAEHGTLATVTLERVEQKVFAVLVGRGADPLLRTLVKKGAWHSGAEVHVERFFDGPLQGSGGRYGCNSQLQLGGEEFERLTFKYRPSTQTMTVTGFVNPRGF
jgi:hypothetical protein